MVEELRAAGVTSSQRDRDRRRGKRILLEDPSAGGGRSRDLSPLAAPRRSRGGVRAAPARDRDPRVRVLLLRLCFGAFSAWWLLKERCVGINEVPRRDRLLSDHTADGIRVVRRELLCNLGTLSLVDKERTAAVVKWARGRKLSLGEQTGKVRAMGRSDRFDRLLVVDVANVIRVFLISSLLRFVGLQASAFVAASPSAASGWTPCQNSSPSVVRKSL